MHDPIHPSEPATQKSHLDPVCGMEVVANPQKSQVFGGETYYFCSQRCVDKFKADPHHYLHEHAPAQPNGTPVEGAAGKGFIDSRV